MSEQGFPGQQGLSDNATEFNKHAFQIWQVLARVRTAIPVEIVAVHVDDDGLAPVGFVDAVPLVNQMDGAGQTFPHGTVFNLPYVRVQGGKNAVICDPEVGDVGLAVICDRDISSVKANKKAANPGSRRRFSLADGVYIGGILNGTPEQHIRFTTTGISISDKNGNSLVMGDTGNILTGDLYATSALEVDDTITVHGAGNFDHDVVAGGAVNAGTHLTGADLQIADGSTITRVLAGSITTNFGGFIAGFATATASFTVAGAKVGDAVALGMTAPGHPSLVFTAYVSATNTVTINAHAAVTPGVTAVSQTYTVVLVGTS